MQEHEIAMVISNARNSSFPWSWSLGGIPYEMPAQASYTVVFRSLVSPAPPNTVEVEYAADSITVWAWGGCLFAVYYNGEALPPGAFDGPHVPAGAATIKNAILKPLSALAPLAQTRTRILPEVHRMRIVTMMNDRVLRLLVDAKRAYGAVRPRAAS